MADGPEEAAVLERARRSSCHDGAIRKFMCGLDIYRQQVSVAVYTLQTKYFPHLHNKKSLRITRLFQWDPSTRPREIGCNVVLKDYSDRASATFTVTLTLDELDLLCEEVESAQRRENTLADLERRRHAAAAALADAAMQLLLSEEQDKKPKKGKRRPVRKELEEFRQELEEFRQELEEQECVVCFTLGKSEWALYPCNHKVLCDTCVRKFYLPPHNRENACPICRCVLQFPCCVRLSV